MENPNKALAAVQNQLPELIQLACINFEDKEKARLIITQELEYLREQAVSNPNLLNCAPQSVIFSVKRAIRNNMTLDPQAGLLYVKTRNVNIGTPSAPNWIPVMEIQETANGLLSKNRMLGRIIDHKRPSVEHDTNGKVVSVTFEYQLPNGRWEVVTFGEYDFERWSIASHKDRSRGKSDASTRSYANQFYTSWKGGIDPEAARAKAIRHGLKKLGTNPMEIVAKNIVIEPIKVIEDSANFEEANDTPDGFVPAEVLSSETQEVQQVLIEEQNF